MYKRQVIAVVAVNNARTTAIAKACKASAVTVINAADQYNIDKQGYPANAAAGTTAGASGAYTATELGNLVPNYLKKLPDIGTTAPSGSDYSLKVVLTPASGGNVATLAITGYNGSSAAIDGCVAP